MPKVVNSNKMIDDACQEFLERSMKGHPIAIEDFIEELSRRSPMSPQRGGRDYGGEQKKLVAALIQCELKATRINGGTPDFETYEKRFPDFSLAFINEIAALPELPPTATAVPKLSSRYELVEKIGTGGIGEVWRVSDQRMRRTMAIKMLRPNYRANKAANIRLRQEAVLTGGLQHPGIPPVYDVGVLENGADFFAMKLVDGKTLDEILKNGNNDTVFLVGVFEQIAQTIAFAHSQNTIHRDLKPQNVMVGEFGEVQVMDWGLAKRMGQRNADNASNSERDSSKKNPGKPSIVNTESDTAVESIDSSMFHGVATRQGDLMGTPAYMSPEQAQGKVDEISKQTDVFGLGVVLFEMLAGERLYPRDSKGIVTRAANADFGSVATRLAARKTDPDLIEICEHCLHPAAEDRPRDANEVATAIQDYQHELQNRLQKAEVEKSSAVVRAGESQKRTRIVAGMASLVMIVSIAGAGAFAWQTKNASESAMLAERAAARADEKAETLKEVNEFFTKDLLSQSSPDHQPDPELTMRVALDRAAKRILNRFDDRPQVEAEIRRQIGICYFGLGEFLKSREHLEISRQLELIVGGPDSENSVQTLFHLAATEKQLGNYLTSLKMYREILAKEQQKHPSGNSIEVLRLKSHIASVQSELGLPHESERVMREIISELSDFNDVDDLDLKSFQLNLASALIQSGQYEEAKDILDKLIDEHGDVWRINENGQIRIPSRMLEFWLVLEAFQSKAEVLGFFGEYKKAEELIRECVFFTSGVLGEHHKSTLGARDALALNLIHQNRIEEAEELLVETVSDFDKHLGAEHLATLGAKNSLASVYLSLKRYDAAESILLEIRQALEVKYDYSHPDWIANTNNLAALYHRVGRQKEAEELYKTALEANIASMSEHHPHSVITMANLADLYAELKKNELAEENYLRAIELAKDVFPEHHKDTRATMLSLAAFYMRMGNQDSAIEWGLKYIESEQAAVSSPTSELSETEAAMNYKKISVFKTAIATLLTKKQRHREAHDLLEDVYELRRKWEGETSKKTLESFYSLLNNEDKNGMFESVKSRILRLLSLINPKEKPWLYWKTQSKLGKSMVALDELESAQSILLEAYERLSDFEGPSPKSKNSALRPTAARIIKLFEAKGDIENTKKWKEIYAALRDEQKRLESNAGETKKKASSKEKNSEK